MNTDCQSCSQSNCVPRKTDSSLLRCYVISARSLQKNNAVQMLDTELRAVDGDVAAVTETWLSKKVNSTHINIPGYNFFRQDRQHRKGGGVGAYVRDSLRTEALCTPNTDSGIQNSHEVLYLKICKCSVLYIVLIVYHPPKPLYNSKDFITRLTDDVDYLWPPYVIGGPLYFCPVVSFFFFLLSFFSSPNLSGRRLDVYHTSTHGVALVRI